MSLNNIGTPNILTVVLIKALSWLIFIGTSLLGKTIVTDPIGTVDKEPYSTGTLKI
jgi:hypothetical protein